MAVSPATAAVGQTLTIALTVTNTGQVDAVNVSPMTLAVGPGATIVSLTTGPTPPGPVTVVAGATQVFIWTYGTSGAGPVTVTGTVTGTDAALAVPVRASASRSATLVPVATMQSILSAAPSSAYQGQTVTVTMTVSNTGNTAIWYIGSSKGAGPAPAGVVSVVSGPTGPSPIDLASLAPHGSVAFSWAYLAVGAGACSFTATASGTDSGSGFPVSAQGTSGSVTILPACLLAASVSVSPAQVGTGSSFDVRLTVTNTGGAAVTGVSPSLTLSDPALATVASGPVPAAGGTVAAGGTSSWAWTLTAVSAGTLTLTTKADGTDAGTSGAVNVSSSAAVVIAPRIPDEIAVYPNPLRSGGLSIYLKLKDDAREVSVDVYDAGMHRVYDGKWRSVPRLQATLDVAGASRWAPGVYYVRAKAAFADGSTQKFPVAKLVVNP